MTGMLAVIPPVIDVVTKGTDWPTIVTGVVGVAGIIGTYWQGKRAREATSQDLRDSLRAETDRALKADRRSVYATFTATVSKMLNADTLLDIEWNATEEATKHEALRAAHVPTMTELYAAYAEVRLVAPSTISDQALAIVDLFSKHFNALIYNKAPDGNAIRDDIRGRRSPLYEAMRADIGV
jgi:hypothetical protein